MHSNHDYFFKLLNISLQTGSPPTPTPKGLWRSCRGHVLEIWPAFTSDVVCDANDILYFGEESWMNLGLLIAKYKNNKK